MLLEDIIEFVPPEESVLFIMLWPNASVEIERAAATRRIDFIVTLPSHRRLNIQRLGHRNVAEDSHMDHATPGKPPEPRDFQTLFVQD
jgi:hypothetical protein